MELKERVKNLKSELVKELSTRDLVGDPIHVEDLINYPTTLIVQSQLGSEIEVEDEMGEIRSFDLSEFAIETLLELI
jgi:uncharacterized spore protein YtfJ